MAGDFENRGLSTFICGIETSARRLKSNMENIFQKYNKPFADNDLINVSTLTICRDKGSLKNMKSSHYFGTSKLESTKRKDELLRSQVGLSNCPIDPNVSRAIARECVKYLDSVVGETEPSDAETLSSDSDSGDDYDDEEEEIGNIEDDNSSNVEEDDDYDDIDNGEDNGDNSLKDNDNGEDSGDRSLEDDDFDEDNIDNAEDSQEESNNLEYEEDRNGRVSNENDIAKARDCASALNTSITSSFRNLSFVTIQSPKRSTLAHKEPKKINSSPVSKCASTSKISKFDRTFLLNDHKKNTCSPLIKDQNQRHQQEVLPLNSNKNSIGQNNKQTDKTFSLTPDTQYIKRPLTAPIDSLETTVQSTCASTSDGVFKSPQGVRVRRVCPTMVRDEKHSGLPSPRSYKSESFSSPHGQLKRKISSSYTTSGYFTDASASSQPLLNGFSSFSCDQTMASNTTFTLAAVSKPSGGQKTYHQERGRICTIPESEDSYKYTLPDPKRIESSVIQNNDTFGGGKCHRTMSTCQEAGLMCAVVHKNVRPFVIAKKRLKPTLSTVSSAQMGTTDWQPAQDRCCAHQCKPSLLTNRHQCQQHSHKQLLLPNDLRICEWVDASSKMTNTEPFLHYASCPPKVPSEFHMCSAGQNFHSSNCSACLPTTDLRASKSKRDIGVQVSLNCTHENDTSFTRRGRVKQKGLNNLFDECFCTVATSNEKQSACSILHHCSCHQPALVTQQSRYVHSEKCVGPPCRSGLPDSLGMRALCVWKDIQAEKPVSDSSSAHDSFIVSDSEEPMPELDRNNFRNTEPQTEETVTSSLEFNSLLNDSKSSNLFSPKKSGLDKAIHGNFHTKSFVEMHSPMPKVPISSNISNPKRSAEQTFKTSLELNSSLTDNHSSNSSPKNSSFLKSGLNKAINGNLCSKSYMEMHSPAPKVPASSNISEIIKGSPVKQVQRNIMFPLSYVNKFSPHNPFRIDSDLTAFAYEQKMSTSRPSIQECLKAFRPRRHHHNRLSLSANSSLKKHVPLSKMPNSDNQPNSHVAYLPLKRRKSSSNLSSFSSESGRKDSLLGSAHSSVKGVFSSENPHRSFRGEQNDSMLSGRSHSLVKGEQRVVQMYVIDEPLHNNYSKSDMSERFSNKEGYTVHSPACFQRASTPLHKQSWASDFSFDESFSTIFAPPSVVISNDEEESQNRTLVQSVSTDISSSSDSDVNLL